MGLSFSFGVNRTTIENEFMNNITQVSQSNCITESSSSASGNVLILNGVQVDGNVCAVCVTATTDSTCTITSTMTNTVENILSAMLDQTNQTESSILDFLSFDASFDWNNIDLNESVTNNISQINQSTCASNTVYSANNNYTYVTNSTIGGDFYGVDTNTSANSSCIIGNYTMNSVYNLLQAQFTQSDTKRNGLVSVIIAIVALLIIIGIVIVFIILIGGAGFLGVKAINSKSQTPQVASPTLSPTPAMPQVITQSPQLVYA